MELHMTTFLIVCPLVFLAGFVDAIGGGGGLISLPAYDPLETDRSGRSDGIDRIISGNQTEYSDR